MQFVQSTKGINQATIDGDVSVWEAIISNPEQADDAPWVIHVLARNIHDAAQTAQNVADTSPGDADYAIVTELKLIGPYGVYAADDVALVLEGDLRNWKEQYRIQDEEE